MTAEVLWLIIVSIDLIQPSGPTRLIENITSHRTSAAIDIDIKNNFLARGHNIETPIQKETRVPPRYCIL